MKKNTLATAIVTGLVMASATSQHPHIAPQMTLRPLAADASQYELLIYGDIGESWWGDSVTAKEVVEQINALPASVTQINVRINSYGGSVSDGLAIYNALRRHSATKAATVDGVAMSVASLIAMAGDTLAMPESAILMIHAPWTYVQGNAPQLRSWADVLDTYAKAMAGAYARKSGKPHDEMLALLLDGQDHYYTGTEAQSAGFVDQLVEHADASADASASGMAGLERYTARAPASVAAMVAAAMRGAVPKPAAPASHYEDETMKRNRRLQNPAGKDGGGGALPTPAQPAAAAPAAPTQPAAAPAAPAAAPDSAAILAADQARRTAIRALFAPHASRTDIDLVALQRQCEDDHNVTPEGAGLRLLAKLGEGAQPLNAGRIEPGAQDAQATFRDGMVIAALHRGNPAAHKLDERSQPYAYLDLNAMARACCERAGIRVAGLSPDQIAIRAMHSTSDFPKILENVVTKSLRMGYEGEMRTFQAFTRRATLTNLKEVSRVQLAGAPALKRVREGGEYEYGTMGEGAEKYSVLKYGRLFALTWETIINDDLDALTRIPQAFGASAASLESDLVWAIFTGNPNMADGVALFHATHGNLGTATALKAALEDAPALDPIAEAREKMMLQKGIEGRYITVRPRHLIVPPKLERTAQKITSPDFVAAKQSATNNVDRTLNLVVEPRLQDASTTAWFMAADPSQIDTIEVGYLQGNEGIYTESKAGFETDGVVVKARHVVGTKAIDHRGLYKNAGA
jgi:ATP-dependent protease ClpP protease subunit